MKPFLTNFWINTQYLQGILEFQIFHSTTGDDHNERRFWFPSHHLIREIPQNDHTICCLFDPPKMGPMKHDPCWSSHDEFWGLESRVTRLTGQQSKSKVMIPFLQYLYLVGPCHVSTHALVSRGAKFSKSPVSVWDSSSSVTCFTGTHASADAFFGHICENANCLNIFWEWGCSRSACVWKNTWIEKHAGFWSNPTVGSCALDNPIQQGNWGL